VRGNRRHFQLFENWPPATLYPDSRAAQTSLNLGSLDLFFAGLAMNAVWAVRCSCSAGIVSKQAVSWGLSNALLESTGEEGFYKALLARVKCAQIKCAALQIHYCSCCDAAFPRAQCNYSLLLSSVRFGRIRYPSVATVAPYARDNCMQ